MKHTVAVAVSSALTIAVLYYVGWRPPEKESEPDGYYVSHFYDTNDREICQLYGIGSYEIDNVPPDAIRRVIEYRPGKGRL